MKNAETEMDDNAYNKCTESAGGLTRSREIAGLLARRIMDGEIAPGERLPTERDLAAAHETTRNVIREALKRLETTGLVEVRRGSGAWVGNPRFTASIEFFDVLVMNREGDLNRDFLRDAIEFRGFTFRLMVRLAALRRRPEEMDCIRELIAEREACLEDETRTAELTLALFREIAQATHNQLCVLMFNTVQRISMRMRDLVDIQTISPAESQEVFRRVGDAFERQDAALAELTVIRYIQSVEKAFAMTASDSGLLYME
jgi:GntR family transcriptional regulator, transcriptional repressor for pyruvate dehydrogenase complex